jgi:hypothetical protein
MSTTTKKIQHKYNPRATYFQGYKIPKKLMLWVPPSVEADFLDNPDLPSIMEFVYYIEANNVERIDTTIYEDSFQQFYDYHINIKKYNKPKSSFCATTADGGVGTEYIIESADSLYENENTITLLSVDGKNITEVYALVTFRLINHQPDTIMVETLCGNQSLPPSGEGTRLINYLMRLAQDIGINNVALHPIDSAIGYYTRLNFIELREDEADAINDEEGITTFKINTRARKNWKKAMNSIRFAIHQKKLKEMEQAKIITRTTFPKKQGIPINPPFSKETQKFIPKLTGKIHDVERNENGDIIVSRVAYKIEPGKSLRLAKMKDEMENAYKMADIIKQNVIIKKKKELPVPVPVPVKEESNSPSSPKLSEKEIERQAREFLKEEENAALKIFKQRKKNEEKKEAKKKRNTKTANLRKTIGRIMANGTRKRKPKHLS